MRHTPLVPLMLAATLLAACAHTTPTMPMARSQSLAKAAAVTRDAFEDLDGRPVDVSDFAGHPVVLAFLGTDGDSPAEVPLLLRQEGGYGPEGVRFVAVGENASAGELRAFAQTSGIDFPVWQDPDGEGLTARGFHGVPAFEFLDASGQAKERFEGFATRGILLAGIAKIAPNP